jgi:F-type H+-transporting ATPase subunit epsilon
MMPAPSNGEQPVASTIACRLITPESKIIDEPIRFASIPAWDGLMGVLPGHAPIVARLGLGELRVDVADSDRSKGGSRTFLVDGGFLQVVHDKMTILAEKAWAAESINESDAKAELAELEARQVPADAEDHEARVRELQHDKRCVQAKVRLAEKSRGRGI